MTIKKCLAKWTNAQTTRNQNFTRLENRPGRGPDCLCCHSDAFQELSHKRFLCASPGRSGLPAFAALLTDGLRNPTTKQNQKNFFDNMKTFQTQIKNLAMTIQDTFNYTWLI